MWTMTCDATMQCTLLIHTPWRLHCHSVLNVPDKYWWKAYIQFSMREFERLAGIRHHVSISSMMCLAESAQPDLEQTRSPLIVAQPELIVLNLEGDSSHTVTLLDLRSLWCWDRRVHPLRWKSQVFHIVVAAVHACWAFYLTTAKCVSKRQNYR